jgi:hypothetical protein
MPMAVGVTGGLVVDGAADRWPMALVFDADRDRDAGQRRCGPAVDGGDGGGDGRGCRR